MCIDLTLPSPCTISLSHTFVSLCHFLHLNFNCIVSYVQWLGFPTSLFTFICLALLSNHSFTGKASLHFTFCSMSRYEMIRSEETGSIHGTFKLISSLKARTIQRENSRKKGEGLR